MKYKRKNCYTLIGISYYFCHINILCCVYYCTNKLCTLSDIHIRNVYKGSYLFNVGKPIFGFAID